MAESTSERLARLLAMVAYLADRDDVPVAELAAHFGVPQTQIMKDVDTLWVSGTPGYQPDDLLDFSADSYDAQRITLTNARGMDRPLRLGPGEAVALIVALRALANLPGMGADPAVASALAKLTAAAGDAAEAAEAIALESADPALDAHVSQVLGTARAALAAGERVHLRYTSASDATSERDVDPLELLSDGEAWFLRGWCLLSDAVRHFRLDRVAEISRTGVDVEPHDVASTSGRVRPEQTLLQARLELTPRSRWVAERFGGEILAERDGAIVVALDVADEAWLARLVLDLGPDVVGLEPRGLAESIAARAAAALTAYEEVG